LAAMKKYINTTKTYIMIPFWIVWIIWFSSEILVNRLLRSDSNDRKEQDKGSLRFIWIMIGIANTLAVLLVNFVSFPISKLLLLPYFGLLIIIIGMIIRFYAIWTLGRFFTVDVTIRENHIIKKDGLYSVIRHPSYLGSLISFLGFGLSLNNWLSLIIIIVLITISFIKRIKIEEQTLIDQFGSDYMDYKKSTFHLIPWIY
jgi:protein-S-isoprenylcysteine O-methyltransferase Ste14